MLNVTILMPCLNESKTLAECILRAKLFLRANGLYGEVLVVDNGSTDNSIAVAEESGARVVIESRPGYGRALRTGLACAKGDYIIYGDCDCSYDFLRLGDFINAFNNDYELVAGNRFAGWREPHAMSTLHYFGIKFLSALARRHSGSKVTDFHCGLRGVKKEAVNKINFETVGMEFATELLVKMKDCRTLEVPVNLYMDNRDRGSHLRPFRDGFRHLHYILSI